MEQKRHLGAHGINDPIIEAEIFAFADTVKTMRLRGRQDADQSFVVTEDYWRTRVFNPLQSRLNCFVGTLQERLRPVSGVVWERQLRPQIRLQEQEVDRELKTGQSAELELENEVHRSEPNKSRMFLRLLAVIYSVFIGFLDGFLGFMALRTIGVSFIYSVLYGCALSLSIILGPKYWSKYIMRAKRRTVRHMRFWIGIFAAACFFGLLGFARPSNKSDNPEKGTSQTEITISNVVRVPRGIVAGMGCAFFVTSLVFTIIVFKTKEEYDLEKKYKAKLKELIQVRKKIRGFEEQKLGIPRSLSDMIVAANNNFENATGLRKWATSMAEQCMSAYADSYTSNRLDHACPSFLAHPPKFTIITFTEP